MSNYSPAQVAALEAQQTWTYAECVAFANTHGLKVRSVIAKVISLQLAYIPKPKTTKAGEPVVAKAAIVAEIAEAVEVPATSLAGLEKATKAALFALLEAVEAVS
jgi:hypothetical protein